MEELKNYGTIGLARLLNIRVILDDNQIIYEGMVDNAPDSIKKLNYSKIKTNSSIINYYVYSELN